MSEKIPGSVFPEALKSEHLKEGIKPIIACVGSPDDFELDPTSDLKVSNSHNVDLYANPAELKERGFSNSGKETYVISPIDNKNKHSFHYHDCTGIVVTGKEKGEQENISFMSHQNPDFFISGEKRKLFETALKNKLINLKSKSEDGTIDAMIFGGKYAKVRQYKEGEFERYMYMKDYISEVNLLAKIIHEELGFEPVVIPPKMSGGEDIAYYDNKERRLYLFRLNSDDPQTDKFSQAFIPSEIEKARKNWKPGQWSLPI